MALTPQEFSLLYVLISNPGVVFTREDLLARVWESNVYVTARGVDALVKRLRRKIENESVPAGADPHLTRRRVQVRRRASRDHEVESSVPAHRLARAFIARALVLALVLAAQAVVFLG